MSQFMLTKGNAPPTPPTGYSTIYIKSNGLPYVKDDAGVESPFTGVPGPTGPSGPTGAAATIAVGTTTTLSAGSPATVANSGSSSAATFNFGIPQGTTGAAGAAATVTVGTTTTLTPGASATVSNSGSSSAAVFNFGIPEGVTGATGAAATATVGTTTTLAPGSSATVTNVGTSSAAVFDFGIPQGLPGTGSGTVTSVGLSLPADYTVTNSPVTSTGTLTAVRASQAQNLVLASPSGVAGAPTYRALTALDVPTLNQNTTGTAAGLSTTLAASSGGTGVANNIASTIAVSGSHPLTLTLSNTTGVTLPTSGTLSTLAGVETLSNKRITQRVLFEAFSATPTINTDNYDEYHATAMSGAITSMTTNLTGTPVTGDILVCEFTDNGTARAITWGTSFESSTITLPTTTVISALLTVTLKWNAASSKWRCVGVA